ncbi:hypothetical protein Tco_0433213 [Tanacetum coccineum]
MGINMRGADIDTMTQVDANSKAKCPCTSNSFDVLKDVGADCGVSSSRGSQEKEPKAGLKTSQLMEHGDSDDEMDEYIIPEGDKFDDKYDIRLKEQLMRVVFLRLCEIDRAASGKLHDKNTDESCEIIENLALYGHEAWNDSKDFVKLFKAISTSQNTSKTFDRILLELEDQINFLLKGPQLGPRVSSTHVPQAYAEAISFNPHPQDPNEPSKQNTFTFRDRIRPSPQLQALGTNFEAHVCDYMTAHTERMEWFENATSNNKKRSTIEWGRKWKLIKKMKPEMELETRIKKGIKNDIEPIAPTRTINRLVLEWEERIKLHQEKEMEFNQCRSKIFKNKLLGLVKVEREVKDEEEVK